MTAPWADDAYGEGFADVYDDWYGDVTDVDATVARVVEAAHGGPVLELGVGTGRIALPLAAAGLEVHGVDVSAAMVARLRAKDPGGSVTTVVGDMVTNAPLGPFSVVLATYNTLLNLTSPAAQAACFGAVAARLRPDGVFFVETSVFDEDVQGGNRVDVRTVEVDRVVLSVTQTDRATRQARGQFVDISADGIRMRPWQIRWSSPIELDAMAAAAGLTLARRDCDWVGNTFGAESTTQVSAYRWPTKLG